MEEFLGNVGEYVQHSPWLALGAVFLGGLLSACAPCVLAMVPLIMAFVGGKREAPPPLRAFLLSLTFVLGLSVTFVMLGMIAALAGKMYGSVSGVWNWVVAAVCVVMGLHLMDVLKFTIPTPAALQTKKTGFIGALLMGLLFGLVSAPCAAPMLIVILAYLAGSGSSVAYGGVLLLAYALGHSALIIVAGTSMGYARKMLESSRFQTASVWMRRCAGGIIVLLGAYFVYVALA